MIIPDEFFKLVDMFVFFVAENARINCREKTRTSCKQNKTKVTLILLAHSPKASSMTGDMRKVAVTRVAATRMKSSAPLVTITLARSVLSVSDLEKPSVICHQNEEHLIIPDQTRDNNEPNLQLWLTRE